MPNLTARQQFIHWLNTATTSQGAYSGGLAFADGMVDSAHDCIEEFRLENEALVEALESIEFDCEMALKDGGYDGVVPTIHETACAALAPPKKEANA